MTWRDACAFIAAHHRHHKPPRGQKFAIGVLNESGDLVGVATCGRPVSRVIQNRPPTEQVLEVNRTCTDGFPNANSALYGAAFRIAMAMGYAKVITDTEAGESGCSLRGAGFRVEGRRKPRKSWAESSVQMRSLRDPIGSGGVERVRWVKHAAV